MGVELSHDKLVALIGSQLERRLRYRCLLLQCGDIGILSHLIQRSIDAMKILGTDVCVLEYSDQFDTVGALSCNVVLERIEAGAPASPMVLAGPLHFLDFWSEQTSAAFWRYLSGFTCGPGILVVDTPRETAVDSAFRVIGRIPGTDIRYLKSRLASAQDGLV